MTVDDNYGMSLIEILVIIVVVVVLATIGHSAFLSYVMRSKVLEAIKVLEEYQTQAMAVRARYGDIDPYYVLFSDGDDMGWVSGSPGGSSAEKQVALKYVDTVTANTGTSGSDTYILIGAKLQHDGVITTGADKIFLAGLEDPDGVITWKCGQSTAQGDSISTEYLPPTCVNTLP